MRGFVLKRLAAMVPTLLGISLLVFLMIHLVPGDPVKTVLGPRASPELQARIREKMGLNDPLPVQIVRFLGNVATGDLGVDVFKNKPVSKIVAEQLPHTIALVLSGIGWAMLIGIPLGCFSAIYRNEVRRNPRFNHGFADGQKLASLPHTELEAHWLAPR